MIMNESLVLGSYKVNYLDFTPVYEDKNAP